MTGEVADKARAWLNSDLDKDSKNQIEKLLNEGGDELVDSFYKDLEFGTGGLRGIMGIGSNRMNKYTIGRATQGLANYLKKTFSDDISVAIAHDSRNNSRFFAEVCASIFSANDIGVYLFEDLRPTPELSFAIRHFGCKSGVVITASHNPKEYNGFKAYWTDGAQITPPHDKNIITEVNAITDFGKLDFEGKPKLIKSVGKEVDELYLNMIKGLSLDPSAIERQKDLKIVYSPIHGTGVELVPAALRKLGFENIHIVEEQSIPDGNFPTVVYPNPEESEAMKIALEKAREIDADLIMATDPDSDRVGIATKNLNGEFELLNGNQTGALLVNYLLEMWNSTGKLKGQEFVVKTIVTTELIKELASHYGVPCYDTLTGFKYIATLIQELEGKMNFIGGGEESYGYLIGDEVRDKDAISACAIIAEMTASAKDQGKSLFSQLIELYISHGFYLESLISITKKGKKGADEIIEMMRQYRENPPKQLAGSRVVKLIDYQSGKSTDLESGTSESIDFPSSNVLQFLTEDGTKVSARPSGTEPKIKFYFGVKTTLPSAGDFEKTKQSLLMKMEDLKNDLGL